MKIALDATYSVGSALSGVGVYSRRLLWRLAEAHAEDRFYFCYRPHRLLRSWHDTLPRNARRRLLHDATLPSATLFHGLNQRMPEHAFRHRVCTFHDLFVMTANYSTPEFRQRFTQQAREAAQRADLVITVSAFTASQVHDLLGVPAERLRVVPHGVDCPADPPPLQKRDPIVLHVGAIQERKNVARLVEAFTCLPQEWQLVLAGSFGYGAERIQAQIADSPARPRIRVLGYVSDAQLTHLYRSARILAFPSLDEGFGMPVLEAMAWGMPVVTSTVSALPEVAANAALLVDPYRTEDIAAALLQAATDIGLQNRLRIAGLRRAQQFPWSKAVQATYQVYRELSGSSAR